MQRKKILDLFAGIGGFSLAAHWMGWKTVAFVEWDKYCQKVLKKNFPNVPVYGDIKEFDGSEHKGQVDIITGGFPCQPFSTAGKRKGRKDERYLWPEMLRIIRETKPTWVVGENVPGITSMDNGKVLEQIYLDLESEGYAVQPFIIPALAVGTWHRRNRIWIIAYLSIENDGRYSRKQKEGQEQQPGICIKQSTITDTSSQQNKRQYKEGFFNFITRGDKTNCYPEFKGLERKDWLESAEGFESGYRRTEWEKHWIETATRICRVNDGIPRRMDRTNRLKSLGNAVIPQLVYEIFRIIEQYETELYHPAPSG